MYAIFFGSISLKIIMLLCFAVFSIPENFSLARPCRHNLNLATGFAGDKGSWQLVNQKVHCFQVLVLSAGAKTPGVCFFPARMVSFSTFLLR